MARTGCPPWPCPCCDVGIISLVQGSLKKEETKASEKEHKNPNWAPEWIDNLFTGWAKCRNSTCEQSFVIAGHGGVEFIQTGPEDADWDEYFVPLLCHPMPRIIKIPQKCPKGITERLEGAFRLFWVDKAACASRLRVTLEEIMNFLGVQSRKKTSNGKVIDLTLHSRLENFTKKNPVIGSQLMALKWLGNTGSHSTSITDSDLLDAFEILEHSLEEIIGQRSKKVAQLVKNLTKKHYRKKK